MNNLRSERTEPHRAKCRNHWAQRGRITLALFAGAFLMLASVRGELAVPFPAQNVSGAVEDYVSRLESTYHDVKTLRAEFVQTYIADGRTRVESGTVYFARGGRMRWDYREPEDKVFLSDGKNLLLYVPAEKQLSRSKVKSSDDARVPFRLLLSRLNLHRVFGRIEFGDQALKPEPGDQVLRALAKHEDEENYREVFMELTPEFDIRRLVIQYADQSRMEFTFNRIDRNVQLSPDLFRFSPPAGTEVIDSSNEP